MVWLCCLNFGVLTVLLYCMGGQTLVWTRRFLLPPLQSLMTLGIGYYLGIYTPLLWYVSLVPLLWIAVWDEGNSGHSWIGKLFVIPWLISVVYGFLASVPVATAVMLFHVKWWLLGLVPLVSIAFVPNLPATKLTDKYSILWRDVLRSAVVAVAWLLVVVLK